MVVFSVLKVCLHWWCKDNSLTWSLVGSIALTDHRSHCICDGGAILIGHWGADPLSKRARPWSFLPVSSRYACAANFRCMPLTPNLKEWCPDDRSLTSLVLVAHWRLVVALATEVSGAGGTPQGTTGVEMVSASPRLGSGREFAAGFGGA
jgi:hypothetical protein